MKDLYEAREKLINEIESEKGFSWNKLFKAIELNAICSEMN